MKVKIFMLSDFTMQSVNNFEIRINEWLKENDGIKIIFTTDAATDYRLVKTIYYENF